VYVARQEAIMLGQRLQQLRATAGLSQPELARRVGVSVETLQDWETDVAEPGSGALSKLAAALGAPEEELAAGLAEAQQGREGRVASAPREKP
jgi:transcriptional regulator with XRE-family HTH domain